MPPASRSTARSAARDEAARKAAHERCSLLTPVAKAFSTDIGVEVASLGVQVHGGMGFIEETGAAQHFRDARIAAIYEGTNGIQALDLVTRKVPLEGGATVALYIDELRATVKAVRESNAPAFGATAARLSEAVDSLERATHWLLAQKGSTDALAGATPYLRLFGNAAGGCMLARASARRLARGRRCAGTRGAGALLRREHRGAGVGARAASPRASRCEARGVTCVSREAERPHSIGRCAESGSRPPSPARRRRA